MPAEVQGPPADVLGQRLQAPALARGQAVPARVDPARHAHSQHARRPLRRARPHAIGTGSVGAGTSCHGPSRGGWNRVRAVSRMRTVSHRWPVALTRSSPSRPLVLLAGAAPAAADAPDLHQPSRLGRVCSRRRAALAAGSYGGGAAGRPTHLVSMRLAASRRSAAQVAMLTPRCRGAVRPKLLDTIRLTQITLRRRGRYVYQSPYEETVPADVPTIGGLKRTGTDARQRPHRPGRTRRRRAAQHLHAARPRHRRGEGAVRHAHGPLERPGAAAGAPGPAGPRPSRAPATSGSPGSGCRRCSRWAVAARTLTRARAAFQIRCPERVRAPGGAGVQRRADRQGPRQAPGGRGPLPRLRPSRPAP